MKISRWIFAFALLGTLIPISSCSTDVSQPASPPQNQIAEKQIALSEVLWWLPDDTEMIAARQHIPKRGRSDAENFASAIGIAEIGLSGIRRGKFAEQLPTLELERMISGSRKFRNTKGFGLLPYEGCTVIFLKSPLPEDHAIKKWLVKNADRTKTIGGHTTYVFGEKLEQDRWYFLIAQPHPQILLCATNTKFFESVLRRRERSKSERQKTMRALPASLEEWKHIDTNADEWALRHYHWNQALLDPTSPFSKRAFVSDNNAVGLTYSLDEKQNTTTVRYLTAPRNAAYMTKAYRNFWANLNGFMNVPKDVKSQPNITAHSNGVIEMKFSVTELTVTETNGMFTFGLLGLMGHAILV